jgi:hypothetical protein
MVEYRLDDFHKPKNNLFYWWITFDRDVSDIEHVGSDTPCSPDWLWNALPVF